LGNFYAKLRLTSSIKNSCYESAISRQEPPLVALLALIKGIYGFETRPNNAAVF
jgi:hypothetical protein